MTYEHGLAAVNVRRCAPELTRARDKLMKNSAALREQVQQDVRLLKCYRSALEAARNNLVQAVARIQIRA